MPQTDPAANSSSAGSVEPLRRLKAVEQESESRVRTIRADVDRRLADIVRETDEAIARAREQAQREREALLAQARTQGEKEAAEILRAGREAAAAIRGRPGLGARERDGERSAVLGPQRTNGKA